MKEPEPTSSPSARIHKQIVSAGQGPGALPADERHRLANFKSPSLLSKWLAGLFIAYAVLGGMSVVSTAFQISLLNSVARGEVGSDVVAMAHANDLRQSLLLTSRGIFYVAIATVFIAWFHRVSRNIAAISAWEPIFTSGWSIGTWFVPFLNWVRPFRMIQEAWWVSASAAEVGQTGTDQMPPPPVLVRAWWMTFVLASIGSAFVSRLSKGDGIPDLQAQSFGLLGIQLLMTIAAALGSRVVRSLSQLQDAAYTTGRRAAGLN